MRAKAWENAMLRRSLIIATIATSVMGSLMSETSAQTTAAVEDPENTLFMDLKDNCRVVIKLRPDLAPKTVARVKELTREGFYNGTPFHRVIEGFMAQGGDPTGSGTGGSSKPNLTAEFSKTAHFLRGTIGTMPGRVIRTAPTASSTSCLPRRRTWTGNTRFGGRWCPAWSA